MKHYIVAAAIGMGLAWAGAAVGQDPAPAGAVPAAPRIAVVNVGQVLRDYDRTLAINDSLRLEQDEMERELLAGMRALERLRHPQAPPADPREQRRLIAQKEARVKTLRALMQEELAERLARATAHVYADLVSVVRHFRRERGYAFVLQIGGTDLRTLDSGTEMNLRIRSQAVLAYDEAADISDAVLADMNRRFAEQQAADAEKKK